MHIKKPVMILHIHIAFLFEQDVKGFVCVKNVTVRVPSCMCWHVWLLRRDGYFPDFLFEENMKK